MMGISRRKYKIGLIYPWAVFTKQTEGLVAVPLALEGGPWL